MSKQKALDNIKKLKDESTPEEWEKIKAQYEKDRKRITFILMGIALPHFLFEVAMDDFIPIAPVIANYYIARYIIRSTLEVKIKIEQLVLYCFKIYSVVFLIRLILGLIVFTLLIQ